MYLAGKMTPCEDHWEMNFHWDYPIGNTLQKVQLKAFTKTDLIQKFYSCINTLLSERLDEWNELIYAGILPKFQKNEKGEKTIHDLEEWENAFKDYHKIKEPMSRIIAYHYTFCKELLAHTAIFKAVIPQHPLLKGYKIAMERLLPEMQKLAKQIMAAEEKVHVEFKKSIA